MEASAGIKTLRLAHCTLLYKVTRVSQARASRDMESVVLRHLVNHSLSSCVLQSWCYVLLIRTILLWIYMVEFLSYCGFVTQSEVHQYLSEHTTWTKSERRFKMSNSSEHYSNLCDRIRKLSS